MSLRSFTCPRCGATVSLPIAWMLGVEVVFPCKECNAKFKTGYRMGALLNALALVAALVAANLCVWLFSSYTLPLFVVLIIPMWLLMSAVFRKKWLIRKACRAGRQQES